MFKTVNPVTGSKPQKGSEDETKTSGSSYGSLPESIKKWSKTEPCQEAKIKRRKGKGYEQARSNGQAPTN